MKKNIFSLLMMSLILMTTNSCSKSNPSSSGGKYSWSCEVNGKSYSWSGSYPDGTNPSSMGLSTFSESALALYLPLKSSKIEFSFIVNFGDIPSAGAYTFNQSNTFPESCMMIIDNANSSSMAPNANMKVTIPNIPSNTYMNTQGANPGSIKGTFSGTVYGPDPNNLRGPLIRYEITNGMYEAIVLN